MKYSIQTTRRNLQIDKVLQQKDHVKGLNIEMAFFPNWRGTKLIINYYPNFDLNYFKTAEKQNF